MFEKCGIKTISPSESETIFSFNLSEHALVRDDAFRAYAFGAGIGPGLPHCSMYRHRMQWNFEDAALEWLDGQHRDDVQWGLARE